MADKIATREAYGNALLEFGAKNENIVLYAPSFDIATWSQIMSEHRGRILFGAGSPPYMTYKRDQSADKCDVVLDLLKKYIQKISKNTVDN